LLVLVVVLDILVLVAAAEVLQVEMERVIQVVRKLILAVAAVELVLVVLLERME